MTHISARSTGARDTPPKGVNVFIWRLCGGDQLWYRLVYVPVSDGGKFLEIRDYGDAEFNDLSTASVRDQDFLLHNYGDQCLQL